MSREIKFRAWDEGHSMMHEDFQFIKSGDAGNDWILFKSHKKKFDPNDPFFRQQLKIMQFTGFKDKHGVDIYEGDIVNVDNSEPEENGEHDVITTCIWDRAGFTLRDQADGEWARQLVHKPHRLTVIGNVHEHPELLSENNSK